MFVAKTLTVLVACLPLLTLPRLGCGCNNEQEDKANTILVQHEAQLDPLAVKGREYERDLQHAEKSAAAWKAKDLSFRASGYFMVGIYWSLEKFDKEVAEVRDRLLAAFRSAGISDEDGNRAWNSYWEKRGVIVDCARIRERCERLVKDMGVSASELDELISQGVFPHWQAVTPDFQFVESAAGSGFTVYPAVGSMAAGSFTFAFGTPAKFLIYYRRGIESRAVPAAEFTLVVRTPLLLEGKYIPRDSRVTRQTSGKWVVISEGK